MIHAHHQAQSRAFDYIEALARFAINTEQELKLH